MEQFLDDRSRSMRRRGRIVLLAGLAWNLLGGAGAWCQAPAGPIAADPTAGGLDGPDAGPFAAPTMPRVRLTIGQLFGESLFGPLRPGGWRPLGLGDLFSEGWDEPYAPAPNPAGEGAPRQTWIGNADGAFYRLFVVSATYAKGKAGDANGYNGSFFLFSPLNRRFEVGWFVPFVNSALDSSAPGTNRYWTDAGDLTIAPRFLLAEDRRYTITSNLFVRVPTGSVRNGNGAASLSPDVEFWFDPGQRRVLRGGLGVTVPTNETPARRPILALGPFTGFNASPSALTSFDARLAYGRYITPADAPIFPDFVYSLSANLHAPLSGGRLTYLSLTPACRFGVGNNWYLLGGVEVPLVGPLPFQTSTTIQLIKNF